MRRRYTTAANERQHASRPQGRRAGGGIRHTTLSGVTRDQEGLFPIVGRDGIARALIHYHFIELLAAGIEQICVIVQPGDDRAIREYLAGPDAAYLKRLEKYPKLYAEALKMRELSGRVSFAIQHEQHGYGHAVYQSKSFAAGEPVLLCLGDHLFRGTPVSPLVQLAGLAAMSDGKSVSAVNRISTNELKGFGTIAGRRRTDQPRLIDVSLIIEKPSPAVAKEQLRVDGLPDDVYLGWFGMHLLAPSIYEVLELMICDDLRDGGEFQLTRAQEIQRQREGYLALEMIDAQRFDFGVPDDFVASVKGFRDK